MPKSIGVAVGINTYPNSPLNGCVNDVVAFLNHPFARKHGFNPDNVRMVADARAKTDEIISRLEWMVDRADSGDKVLFYYSGHGAGVPVRGDTGEVDGMDEVICPVDFDWSEKRMISDNQLAKIFSRFKPGVRFVMITDCCHSGTLTKHINGLVQPVLSKRMIPPADIAWRMKRGIRRRPRFAVRATANSVHISGCRDDQTSADAWFVGAQAYRGALSYYLEAELNKSGAENVPVNVLVSNIRTSLGTDGFDQVPQLTGVQDCPLWETTSVPALVYPMPTVPVVPTPVVAPAAAPAVPVMNPAMDKLKNTIIEWHTSAGLDLVRRLNSIA